MDKWFKDILPDKDPYYNRGRDQMRKRGGPEFECLCINPCAKQSKRSNILFKGKLQSVEQLL